MLNSSASPSRTMYVLTNLSVALVVVILIIVGEYVFRHYLLFWMPTFGMLLVNDMVSLFLVYSFLLAGVGQLRHTRWPVELAGHGQAIQDSLRSWKFTFWFVLLIVSMNLLTLLDKWLAGIFSLPMVLSATRNPSLWFSQWAPLLKVVSLLLVNGLFAPVAEEYLWRGIVQVHLLRILPPPAAIAITAVLFSLKHVVVDASWGRFLAIIAFGVICGIVAKQASWRHSATLHMLVNTLATAVSLALG